MTRIPDTVNGTPVDILAFSGPHVVQGRGFLWELPGEASVGTRSTDSGTNNNVELGCLITMRNKDVSGVRPSRPRRQSMR